VKRALVAALVLVPLVASGAPTPESARANADGQKEFRAGHYLEAVAAFERAYAIDPDPAYLFDLAQAYRLAKDCDKALAYYDQFLHAVPNPPNVDKIRGYRDASAACATAKTPPPPPQPVQPVAPPATPLPAPSAPVQPHDTTRHTGGTLRTIGIATVAFGVVAVAGGVYASKHAADLQHSRDAVCPDGCTWTIMKQDQAADLDRRGHDAQTWSYVGYGVAGAAIATGIVLFVVGRDHASEPAIAAAPTRGGAVVVAHVAF
jgi:tetratricopeptide (TPR) repeat protein